MPGSKHGVHFLVVKDKRVLVGYQPVTTIQDAWARISKEQKGRKQEAKKIKKKLNLLTANRLHDYILKKEWYLNIGSKNLKLPSSLSGSH